MSELLLFLQDSYSRLVTHVRSIDWLELGLGLLLVLGATIALVIFRRVMWRVSARVEDNLRAFGANRIGAIRFQRQPLLSGADVGKILGGLWRGVHWIVFLLVLYFYLSLALGVFPLTRDLALALLGAVIGAVGLVAAEIVAFVPNLALIGVVVVLSYYLVRLADLIFAGIGKGRITIGGFYAEWARPTFNLLRALIYVLTLVVVFPYLPGSGSPAFQGISIFVGVLLSLGSTSAVANVVAGIVITYMRAFQDGDRVQIGATVGDVVERSLLVTKIRTTKNVDTTIPNSTVLASHIINFSSFAEENGVILHTTVTIGYDVPWREVHDLLLGAAEATEAIEAEPAPFVLQTSLDDFYVSYELNGYSRDARLMPATYSELHQHIQDRFNEAGVEIMSPHYGALRDGNETTTPAANRPAPYEAPGFRVHPLERLLHQDKPE